MPTALVYEAAYGFGSEGDLDVSPQVLGWAKTLQRDGAQVTIRFPERDGPSPNENLAGAHAMSTRDGIVELFAVDYFTITVQFETDVTDIAPRGETQSSQADELRASIDAAAKLANQVAYELRRWLYVHHTYLGPPDERPPRVQSYPVRRLDTGEPISTSKTVQLNVVMPSLETALTQDQVEDIGQHLVQLEEPPAPESLLAQAWASLAVWGDRAAQPELGLPQLWLTPNL